MKETSINQEENDAYTEIFAWGGDRYGQLGLGNEQIGKCYPIPRFCSFSVIIKVVSCGEEHSALITGQGEIFTVGSNNEGRLGLGDKNMAQSSTPCFVEALSQFNAIQISCGWGHTAAVMNNGELYTWGVGEYGALGIHNTESQWSPVKVTFGGHQQIITEAKCGTRHTAIVDSEGRLYMCGSGDAGQLGTGSREKELVPKIISSIPEKIVHTAGGIFHTLAISRTGKLYAMGGNNFGQLGTGNKRSSAFPTRVKDLDPYNIIKIAAGNHSAALTDRGEVFVWGTGVFGEYLSPIAFGKGVFNEPIQEISIGGSFGAAIDRRGTLYSWGSNTNGELGMGDFEAKVEPSVTKGLQGKVVTNISCGGSYVIALGITIDSERLESIKNSQIYQDLQNSGNNLPIEKIEEKRPPQDYHPTTHKYNESEIGNELISAINEEKEKRLRLEKQLEELELAQKQLTQREESMGIGIRSDSIELKNKIDSIEKQLEAEKKKGYLIIKEIEAMKAHSAQSNNRKFVLEQNITSLQRDIELMTEENLKMKRSNKYNDNSKLSILLRDYEEKIQAEIQDKYKVLREKQKEISDLHDTIPKLNSAISNAEGDRLRLEDYYKNEIKKLESLIKDYNEKIFKEEEEKAQVSEIHIKNCEKADELRRILLEMGQKKERTFQEIEDYKENINQLNFQLANRHGSLEEIIKQNNNLEQKIITKEENLKELKEKCTIEGGNTMDEIDKLERQIADQDYDNEDIQGKINVKQIEIDTLNKDVFSWKQVSNNVETENDALRKIIEVLEEKNKKLADYLNVQLESRDKENKERIIHSIKISQTPLRIQKIIAGNQNLQYTPDNGSEIQAPKPLTNTQPPVIEVHENLLKALETYTPDEGYNDEGKPLEREDKIIDPYLHEREILREFESMLSPEKSANVEDRKSVV